MHIILLLLKIIGWILLIVLGLLVLTVCLVLFTPLRYQVQAKCDGDVSSLSAEADFSVFFRLVRASVCYVDQKLSWQLRVAFKKFSSEPEEKSVDEITHDVADAVGDVADDVKQTGEKVLQGESVQQAVEETAAREEPEPNPVEKADAAEPLEPPQKESPIQPESSEPSESPQRTMSAEAPRTETAARKAEPFPEGEPRYKKDEKEAAKTKRAERKKVEEKKAAGDKKKESVFSKITNLYEKLKCTFKEICDKIEALKKKKDVLMNFITDETHVGALKKVLAELKRLLRKLLPKKFQADVHFGFEDPSITGRVLAGISMLYPAICEHTQIQPDFQQKVLEGKVFIKGHVRACIFASMLLRLLLNANVRRTLLDVKNFSFDV